MMTKRRLILFAVTLFSTALSLKAQVSLPLNSYGKAEAADIAVVDSTRKSELFERAIDTLPALAGFVDKMVITEKDSAAGRIVCDLKYIVYTQQIGILKKKAGEVTYKLTIEVKNSKYRYSISNFLFHYFKQDRNYKLVETGQTKGLEERKAAGWQKTWDACRDAAASKVNQQTTLIQSKMKEKKKVLSPITTETKKVDW
jgi:hypothetical protein